MGLQERRGDCDLHGEDDGEVVDCGDDSSGSNEEHEEPGDV